MMVEQPEKHDTVSWFWVNMTLDQRRRRWSNIKPALAQCLVFAGFY